MRTITALLAFIILCGYSCSDEGNSSTEFRDLSQTFSVTEFENIKSFILDNGDRQTYCNMYLDNPHYSFEGFEAYLSPETGQRNINCDPEISDFNELVVRDQDSEPQYFYILIVRRGGLENEDIWFNFPEGMREDRVYLLRNDDNDLDLMEDKIEGYIGIMKNKSGGR